MCISAWSTSLVIKIDTNTFFWSTNASTLGRAVGQGPVKRMGGEQCKAHVWRRDSITCARESPCYVNRARCRRRNRRKKGRRTTALINGPSMGAGHYFPKRETRDGDRKRKGDATTTRRAPAYVRRAPVASGIKVCNRTRARFPW